ncbi:conserved Plasmodium protein, unknown function [Babesia microti strain RI]|uniref:Nucleotide exchange factor SIL1 n=1 Tax=Babesia microti (strain RI) TaxID=1133968 RepID=I7J5B7_BABMR|nr:conserved Plasmodium protein, unknown function [Babesia microti strain RI]CCF72727.1 conserved Plasmodium protein, unknown function [Babesia microti strain RI]|eukprot:XP_012647336.1 conserved Plasmodium protein, unknown function [Babesia microti strain RI]
MLLSTLVIILSTFCVLESLHIQTQSTFISANGIQFARFRRKTAASIDEQLNIGENNSTYWYKLPKEYKVPSNNVASPTGATTDQPSDDHSISVEELNDLGISSKSNYFDLDDKSLIDNPTSPSLETHPLSDVKNTPSTLPNANLVEDLYYTDILLSTKENESSNLDPLASYENDLLNSSITNEHDKYSIDESLREANRMIHKSETVNSISIDTNESYADSTFPKIEHLPQKNLVTGKYLIDRHLIHKVACLRSCLEILEKGVAKNEANDSINGISADQEGINNIGGRESENPLIGIFCCFNDSQMRVFKQLVLDEGLFEEVLGRAITIYERAADTKSLERITWIATHLGPWVNQLRKDTADQKLSKLISAALTTVNGDNLYENNQFFGVLWDYCEKGLLDRYLVKRCEEVISEASKRYRVDDGVASVSEIFLTSIKNQIIAQMITNLNGTDVYVKTLAECLNANREDWRRIVNCNIKSLEGIEEFIGWLGLGAEFLSRSERPGKMASAEDLLEIAHELSSEA